MALPSSAPVRPVVGRVNNLIRRLPFVGNPAARLRRLIKQRHFVSSADYWRSNYAAGGTSGPGSYGALAQYKADTISRLLKVYGIKSVVEFGCGDGHQASLIDYPHYLGLDISIEAVDLCRCKLADRDQSSCELYRPGQAGSYRAVADAAVSLDVIFHLVEDDVYEQYLADLFASATRYVILYTSDADDWHLESSTPEVRHRPVKRDIARFFKDWACIFEEDNPHKAFDSPNTSSFARFTVYGRL